MKAVIFLIAALTLTGAGGEAARAHALQPGYLELQMLGGETWRAFWRKPAVSGGPMPIDVTLPDNCDARTPPEPTFDGAAWVAQWVTACPGGLAGGVISVTGLESTQTDVLIRYELSEGEGEAQRLTPNEPSFVVPVNPGFFDVLSSYFTLGVDHILEGLDHLLFVFALLLLIPNRGRLLGAVTAFTVAHSITMAAATLGAVSLPSPPVETVIALSIMFLASELLQRDGTGTRLSERFPWIVSFSFGLLHGFGFAGALLEIGLPRDGVPLALLSFNLGVEAGQILFIAAVLIVAALLARIVPVLRRTMRTPRSVGSAGLAYVIGGVSAFWFIERIAGF
jgi:hydrogenase/urease accessory protein HupE